MAQLVDSFLFDLNKFFTGGNSWQAGLYQQIEGLSVDQVTWKPSPDRHSIWDVLIHVNFWKQYAIASVCGTDKPDPDAGNWTLAPVDASETNWKKEVERTKSLHEELKRVAQEMGDSLYDTEKKLSNYIRQLICHDAYHAGQIGLLRVMQGLKPVE
jgi:DinB family protein